MNLLGILHKRSVRTFPLHREPPNVFCGAVSAEVWSGLHEGMATDYGDNFLYGLLAVARLDLKHAAESMGGAE